MKGAAWTLAGGIFVPTAKARLRGLRLRAAMAAAVDPFVGTTRYIDTDVAAGGNGTIGNPYSTLFEAMSAFSNPTTLLTPWRLLCSGVTADPENVVQPQWDRVVTSATNYLLVEGNNTSGKWNTSAYRIEVEDVHGLYCNTPGHIRWNRLQVQVTSNSGSHNCFRSTNMNQADNDVDFRVSNCIARGIVNGGVVTGFIPSSTASGNGMVTHWNDVAFGCTTGFASAWSSARFYNCTSRGNTHNYVDPMVLRNCISAAHVTSSFNNVGTGGGASSHNASSDGTAPGSNSRTNQTFDFVNTGAFDFRLTGSDTGGRNFGVTDPSGGMYSDAIDGTQRPVGAAWDMGAGEV